MKWCGEPGKQKIRRAPREKDPADFRRGCYPACSSTTTTLPMYSSISGVLRRLAIAQ
jgi:hypothetical protein